MTADREERLPKWAQDELRRLRATVAGLEGQLTDALAFAAKAPSGLFAIHYNQSTYALEEVPLTARAVRGAGLDVAVRKGRLEVRTAGLGGQVAVRPVAANVVELEVEK